MASTVHTTFIQIKIHTAKCDTCNKHNTLTMMRCADCGQQCCTPCWQKKGGDGTHILNAADKGWTAQSAQITLALKSETAQRKSHGRARAKKQVRKRKTIVVDGDNNNDDDDETEEELVPTLTEEEVVPTPTETNRTQNLARLNHTANQQSITMAPNTRTRTDPRPQQPTSTLRTTMNSLATPISSLGPAQRPSAVAASNTRPVQVRTDSEGIALLLRAAAEVEAREREAQSSLVGAQGENTNAEKEGDDGGEGDAVSDFSGCGGCGLVDECRECSQCGSASTCGSGCSTADEMDESVVGKGREDRSVSWEWWR